MRTPRSQIVELAVAALLAFAGLSWVAHQQETRFDELALGAATTSTFAEVDGRRVHGHTYETMKEVFAAMAVGGREHHQFLWLGNSQLHAINQYVPGDQTAPALLSGRLAKTGVDVATLSFPNANLQEHYLVFTYARFHLRRLRVVILPLVFDDLRESGIRDDLRPTLGDARVREALENTLVGRSLLDLVGEDASNQTPSDFAGVAGTLQERSERFLDQWLDKHWLLWRRRAEARGRLFTNLYLIRNSLLGIDSQTKRPLLRAAYDANMAALRHLLNDARENDIRVLLYIAPLRPDVDPPYVLAEYEAFRAEVRTLVDEGVSYADFGDLVPGPLWGLADGAKVGGDLEVDFMHFQAGGHELLAGAVADTVASCFAGSPK